jgi:glycerol dehydrogenase-like iron-containing ADH family enzyme
MTIVSSTYADVGSTQDSRRQQASHQGTGAPPFSTPPIPELQFTHATLERVVSEYVGSDTAIITDTYNEHVLRRFDNVHVVHSAEQEQAAAILAAIDQRTATFVAVGGCTALDVARYCTGPHRRLVAVPSILSTSCISVNRAVLYRNGIHQALVTAAPRRIVISYPLLLGGAGSDVWKWSHSGFGDLFSNFSASIDVLWHRGLDSGKADGRVIANLAPVAMRALDWVISKFRQFDEETITELATFLHESSLDVLRRGSTELSAAGEHDLYYSLLLRQRYPRHCPTHGQIVAAGTLIAIRAHAQELDDRSLADRVEEAFRMLRLPRSYGELRQIGIERQHLLDSLSAIRHQTTHLSWCFHTLGAGFVDTIFDCGD